MIKIVTACNDSKPYGELADICKFTIKRYCKKHGFGYSFYRISETERPPAWYKIPVLLKEFESRKTRYCLWLDVDSMIYNPGFDLRSILKPDKELYLSKDFNGINAGVMLWKNTRINKRLLNRIWNAKRYINYKYYEQTALVKLVQDDFQGIQNRIEYVPQSLFNAYDYSFYQKTNMVGQMNADSFILHFPGLTCDVRKQEMGKYLREAWRPTAFQLALSHFSERLRKTPRITSPCPSSPK